MAGTAKFSLPELTYPYPRRIHPETGEAEQHMLDWLAGHGLIRGPEVHEAFLRTGFAGLVGEEYAAADSEGLRVVANFYGWMFVMDDYVTDTAAFGKDLGKLSAFTAWMRQLCDSPTDRTHLAMGQAATENMSGPARDFCHQIAEAAADLFGAVADRATPSQYMRLVAEMSYFFQGMQWEAGHHVAGTLPTPDEYVIGRRMTSATPAGLALQDIAAGYEVPANDYHQPRLRELRAMTANINSWCNDIFSYGKESDSPDTAVLNLPASLVRYHGYSEQGAIEEAARRHNDEVMNYLAAEEAVARDAGPEVMRFLDAMRMMQRGFYDWGLTTSRYNVRRYFTNCPAPTAAAPH
ncbi:terpene synthase family protein [Allokutzneria albata]|uniref:Terpene synthase n=1 Tax=Allokutzneria albata TaxID=211114 RepID=A0A1G9S4L4_ALLAB|nr:hypothetical protein [Allokutzneria albata]SDM30443.1 hypothetical protein SAMN04489726_0888 [Allokutzneria albata]